MDGRPSVVAVGAHADDLALQCSGTLAALKKLGARITQVIMTVSPSIDHYGRINTTKEVNLREIEDFSKLLGIDSTIIFEYLNNEVPYSSHSVQQLNKVFDDMEATLILTHWLHESQQDHQNACKSVITAARKYRNILTFEEHIGRPRVSTIPFSPTVYCDISETLGLKMKAIECFQSQYNRLGSKELLKIWEYRARIRGAEVGVYAAEAFEPVKLFINDLWLFDNHALR